MLPYDLARGAQVYARSLCDALDGDVIRHQILTLFQGSPGVLRPDHALDVPQHPWRRLGYDPRVSVRLRAALVHLQPDVLVTHGGEPLKYVAPLRDGVPLIHYRIGISAVTQGPRVQLMRSLHQSADVVAGVSKECLEEAQGLFGVPTSRCVLLTNGRDPDLYSPATKPTDPPQLLWLGHFAPTKRPGVFLDVVQALHVRGLSFAARMIGSGDLLDDAFRSRAEALQVELLGRRTDVPDLLPQASVFLFTSIPEGEGMPGVFIEAGQCGIPTVATSVPGASTVIEDGVTGVIRGHDDIEGLIEACANLLNNTARRQQMGNAARQRCADRFSDTRGFARWSHLIQRALP